jgi:hypothetical protein
MLNVVMLNVVELNVVMLSVVAPGASHGKIHSGELKVLLENIRLGQFCLQVTNTPAYFTKV